MDDVPLSSSSRVFNLSLIGETPDATKSEAQVEAERAMLEGRVQKVRLVIFSVLLALYTIVFLKFTQSA